MAQPYTLLNSAERTLADLEEQRRKLVLSDPATQRDRYVWELLDKKIAEARHAVLQERKALAERSSAGASEIDLQAILFGSRLRELERGEPAEPSNVKPAEKRGPSTEKRGAMEMEFLNRVKADGWPEEGNEDKWDSQADVIRYFQQKAREGRRGYDLKKSTARDWARLFLKRHKREWGDK